MFCVFLYIPAMKELYLTVHLTVAWDQVPHWGKRRKKSARAKTKIGERSEPRGSQGRGKGAALSPLPRTPFFAFFPHCGAWSQANFT